MSNAMQDKKSKKSDAGKGVVDGDAVAELSLRAARDELGITIDEVAHELHLSREVVLSLEAGDYESLGAPVFVRGHLRNYARLVGLPEEDVVEGYKPYEPEPEEFRTLSAHTIVKPGASLPNFVLWGMLLLLLLIAASYLLLGDDGESASSSTDSQVGAFAEPQIIEETDAPSVAAPVESKPEVKAADTGSSSVVSAPDRSAFEVKQEPLVNEEPEIIELPVIEPPVVAEVASASLILKFSEECWVEISDSKRRILYGLEKPGSEVELTGTPPFRLFIGNVAAVKIEVAGRPFSIPKSGLRGNNTARFSLTKDDI
jgi:cytoskeleton protein RodZ